MAEWLVKRGDRERSVPNDEILRQHAQAGRVRPDDLVRSTGTPGWSMARDIVELEGCFGDGAAAAPTATVTTEKPKPAAMTSRWLVRRGTDETSTQSTAELVEWAGQGLVLPTDYIYHPVFARWLYGADVQELAEQFRSANAKRRSRALNLSGTLHWLVGIVFALLGLTTLANATFLLGLALFTAAVVAKTW